MLRIRSLGVHLAPEALVRIAQDASGSQSPLTWCFPDVDVVEADSDDKRQTTDDKRITQYLVLAPDISP